MKNSEHPIFLKSIEYIRSKIELTDLSNIQRSVLERIIHSSGDLSLKPLLRFSPNACSLATSALKNGAEIWTDTHMAAAAISPTSKRTLNSNVRCILEMAPAFIDSLSTTRSAIGMRKMWLEMSQKNDNSVAPPIVAIGSAPTALTALLDLIDKGGTKPSLIVGMPVGFIGVSESKKRLLTSGCTHIVLEGSKGGASLAAATINALLKDTE